MNHSFQRNARAPLGFFSFSFSDILVLLSVNALCSLEKIQVSTLFLKIRELKIRVLEQQPSKQPCPRCTLTRWPNESPKGRAITRRYSSLAALLVGAAIHSHSQTTRSTSRPQVLLTLCCSTSRPQLLLVLCSSRSHTLCRSHTRIITLQLQMQRQCVDGRVGEHRGCVGECVCDCVGQCVGKCVSE